MTDSSLPAFPPVHSTFTGEAFCTSGTSPTVSVHLVGAGQVGQAFLRQLAGTPLRLVGISDSSATLHRRDGLDPVALGDHKARGGRLRDLPGAESLSLQLAIDLVDADILVDATPSGVDPQAAVARNLRVLRRGRRLVLAAKDTLCHAAGELLAEANRPRVGIHAVLGGTGAELTGQLDELRRDCDSIALVGNASTTAVIEAIERGDTVDAGIRAAQEIGVLEPDPELDLSGTDAAVKVVAVSGALWGCTFPLEAVSREHLRDLDPEVVRERRSRGRTTRLVARARAGEAPRVTFEEIPRSSSLAVPADRVAYAYRLTDGRVRLHVGHGIGPWHTAAALHADLSRLAGAAQRIRTASAPGRDRRFARSAS